MFFIWQLVKVFYGQSSDVENSHGNNWYALAVSCLFAIVAVMLVIDFVGFKHQHGQEVKVRTAAYWSIAWVSVATLFGGGLWLYLEQTAGAAIANTKVMEYFAGYLLEKSLAIDNVFCLADDLCRLCHSTSATT